jgi:hypothetical protein
MMNLALRSIFVHTCKGSLTCRKVLGPTWGRRLYFSSEGRRTEDFIALKNPSPGLNARTLGMTSTLTITPPRRLKPHVHSAYKKLNTTHPSTSVRKYSLLQDT